MDEVIRLPNMEFFFKKNNKIPYYNRTVWLCDGDHSTSAPDAYAERFREFMLDHL